MNIHGKGSPVQGCLDWRSVCAADDWTGKNFGLGVSVGEMGGDIDVGWQSDVRKEVNYCQDLSKAEEYDLDAHCDKKVRK